MRAWARTTLRVGGWAVLLAAVAVLAATVVVPRLAGAHTYAVLSASMEPTLAPGSVVIVRPVDVEDIAVGSIITFQMETGKPAVATHRVVTQAMRDGDKRIFRTQGDANEISDRRWVRPVQIKGEVWYSVPFVGRATNLLSSSARDIGIVATAAALFGYAALMFLSSFRDRRRVSHA